MARNAEPSFASGAQPWSRSTKQRWQCTGHQSTRLSNEVCQRGTPIALRPTVIRHGDVLLAVQLEWGAGLMVMVRVEEVRVHR